MNSTTINVAESVRQGLGALGGEADGESLAGWLVEHHYDALLSDADRRALMADRYAIEPEEVDLFDVAFALDGLDADDLDREWRLAWNRAHDVIAAATRSLWGSGIVVDHFGDPERERFRLISEDEEVALRQERLQAAAEARRERAAEEAEYLRERVAFFDAEFGFVPKALSRALRDVTRDANEFEPEQEESVPESDPEAPSEPGPPPDGKASQADVLVALAAEHYDLGVSTSGEPFAVEKDGPSVALRLRGGKNGTSLRAALAALYVEQKTKVPSASALSDAMTAIEGFALRSTPTELHLRVAEHGSEIVLDLGDASGRVVVIGAKGWRIEDRSPVLFYRTAANLPLPEPERGGRLEALRSVVNISDEAWPLVLAWLVSALVAEIPHPLALLSGTQGSGKTDTGRALVSILDPSEAPLRSEPKSLDDWSVAANASWIVGLDNVSRISPEFSDALCRAATGDGLVKRTLYSDSDVTVLSFRRVLLITAIDPGALRGDLADRLLTIEMGEISRRREEREIEETFARSHGAILGGLLDLAVQVFAVMPDVQVEPERLPRMADFARIVAAVDRVLGTSAFETYVEMREEVARDVVLGHPVANALAEFTHSVGSWDGTCSDLGKRMLPYREAAGAEPRVWPKTPQGWRSVLMRFTPALRSVGVEVEKLPGRHTHDGQRNARLWRLSARDRSATDATDARPIEREQSVADRARNTWS